MRLGFPDERPNIPHHAFANHGRVLRRGGAEHLAERSVPEQITRHTLTVFGPMIVVSLVLLAMRLL